MLPSTRLHRRSWIVQWLLTPSNRTIPYSPCRAEGAVSRVKLELKQGCQVGVESRAELGGVFIARKIRQKLNLKL